MSGQQGSVATVRLHLATSLDSLLPSLADDLWTAPGDVLRPLWCVVPTTSIRTWVDQNLARRDQGRSGGVTANLRTILPKDLTVEIEQMTLGDEWVDFGTETMALRLLGALHLDRFGEARRLAESIDEVVRWRPHLLEPAHRSELPGSVLEAMEELDLFEHGAHVQRQRVLESLVAGEVAGLPSRLSVFGLPEVMGGPRFLDLLHALAATTEVAVYLPVPDVGDAVDRLEGREGASSRGWQRETAEALDLWASLAPEVIVAADGEASQAASTTLHRLQQHLVGHPVEGAKMDDSVTLVGSFGDERQAEQIRDVIFESIANGVAPHEILVVSPDPTAFAVALERHWNYQPHEDDGGPRLAFELTTVRPRELTNRLGVSLALLRLAGNYATVEQIADLLAMPAVASTLRLDLDARQQLIGRAREGKLIFGVTAEQRARFGVYEPSSQLLPADIGTWERIIDAVAVATIYPPVRPGEVVRASEETPLQPLGEPMDLAAFASLQPLLRILEAADSLRAAPRLHRPSATEVLGEWLDLLESWMATVAVQGGSGDDSFERSVRRLRRSIQTVAGLDELEMTFEQFLELWDTLATSRGYSRLHGRRGVVVAGLEDFSWARFKVVCILGLDDDKLPEAGLPSPIMSTFPPGAKGRRPAGDPDRRRRTQGALLAAVLGASERLVVSWNVSSEESGAAVEPSIVLSEFLDRLAEVTGIPTDAVLENRRMAVRRHGFFDDHDRPRFDGRLHRIDAVRSPKVGDRLASVTDDLALDELVRFFRNPIGQHLRRARNVLTPFRPERATVRPRTSVDDLTKYRFRERFIDEASQLPAVVDVLSAIADGETFESAFDDIDVATTPLFSALAADPDLMGDVPPLFWSTKELKAQLDLFVLNRHFDLFDHEVIESPDDPCYLPIDLGDGLRLTLTSPHAADGSGYVVRRLNSTQTPSVLHFHPSKGAANRAVGAITQMLLELLTLRINHPDQSCRVVTYYLPKSANRSKQVRKEHSVPKGSRGLNSYFELSASPETLPAVQALDQLQALVGMFRRGMEEVPVLFRRTSAAAAFDGYSEAATVTPWGEWAKTSFTKHEGIGEETELMSRLLFPYSYKDLVRTTSFTRWAKELGQGGRGARWHFGGEVTRPVPTSLKDLHEGFQAYHEGRYGEGLDEARQTGNDKALARYLGIGSPLLRVESEDGAE